MVTEYPTRADITRSKERSNWRIMPDNGIKKCHSADKDSSKEEEAPKETRAEDTSWVSDSLIEFLRSPLWRVPILNFIESRSVVFEPAASGNNNNSNNNNNSRDDDEENDQQLSEYKLVHQDYKRLVDLMLDSYMKDMEITAEQFERACTNCSTLATSGDNQWQHFHRQLFELLWAADNFVLFRRMMTRANIELQLQVIEMLKQHQTSAAENPKQLSRNDTQTDGDEATVLREAMKRSAEEYHQHTQQLLSERAELDRALEESELDKKRLQMEKDREQKLLEAAVQMSLEISGENGGHGLDGDKKAEASSCAPLKDSVLWQEKTAGSQRERSIKDDTTIAANHRQQEHRETTIEPTDGIYCPEPKQVFAAATVTADQVEKRRLYLSQQRDRLLALKEQERLRILDKDENGEASASSKRPQSSRAAREALSSTQTVDDKTRAARRQLAQTLRTHVVDKSSNSLAQQQLT